jgi:hypothetical protein
VSGDPWEQFETRLLVDSATVDLAFPSLGAHVGVEPKGAINRLRSRARRMGIAIRTARPHGSAKGQTFSLVDRKTGTILVADVDGLVELERRLALIGQERGLAQARLLPEIHAPAEFCWICSTRRVGRFRWCRSCGFDFELAVHGQPPRPVFQLQAVPPAIVDPPTQVDRPATVVRPADPVFAPSAMPLPSYLRDMPRKRFPFMGFAFRDRYPSVSLRAMGLWVVATVLIGLLLGIAIGGTR